MADIIKYQASECKRYIGHNLRDIPEGKTYRNESIDSTLTKYNYSLIKRGENAEEVNKYRKQIDKECFSYNRKNLVHGVEVVVQCPDDCPEEQKESFFEETFNYICLTLPMGERCVFVAEVHKDEHKFITKPDGTKVDISKDHLHVMYVPAVPDNKHEKFEYKLCADELTKRAKLKAFHPGLQKHLDDCGIHATVYRKKSGDGKTIALSVSQLKEITDKTGIVIKKSLTIDELAEILQTNRDIKIHDAELAKKIEFYQNKTVELSLETKEKDTTITALKDEVVKRDEKIQLLQNSLSQKEKIVDSSQAKEEEISLLQDELTSSKLASQRMVESLQEKINSLEQSNLQLAENYSQEIAQLNATISSLQKELTKSKEQLATMEQSVEEKQSTIGVTTNDTWGQSNTWGTDKTWGTTTLNQEEEKLW